MNSTELLEHISAGSCLPYNLGAIAPGHAVIIGRSAAAGELGATGTYMGQTFDGLAVVRVDGLTIDLGAGVGVEEWPVQFVESMAV
jgi:hypothetical protein